VKDEDMRGLFEGLFEAAFKQPECKHEPDLTKTPVVCKKCKIKMEVGR